MQTEDISATESSCAVAERDVPVDKLEAAGSSQGREVKSHAKALFVT